MASDAICVHIFFWFCVVADSRERNYPKGYLKSASDDHSFHPTMGNFRIHILLTSHLLGVWYGCSAMWANYLCTSSSSMLIDQCRHVSPLPSAPRQPFQKLNHSVDEHHIISCVRMTACSSTLAATSITQLSVMTVEVARDHIMHVSVPSLTSSRGNSSFNLVD